LMSIACRNQNRCKHAEDNFSHILLKYYLFSLLKINIQLALQK
jgi:hypothetical protein